MHKHLFFKTNLFKEWMQKFIALLTKKKVKMAMSEWEIDGSNILWVLYSVYKKNRAILFLYVLVNLFKQKYISSAKL